MCVYIYTYAHTHTNFYKIVPALNLHSPHIFLGLVMIYDLSISFSALQSPDSPELLQAIVGQW